MAENFPELIFGLYGGAIGEKFAALRKVGGRRGRKAWLCRWRGLDGILHFDGELPVRALVIVELDARERARARGAGTGGGHEAGGRATPGTGALRCHSDGG